MLRKFLISLWLLLQLLAKINCQMITYKPLSRIQHTATLIDNKLYILSGYDFNINKSVLTNDFFYLDVFVPFNTQSLS